VWVHYLSKLLAPWSAGLEPVKDLYWDVRRTPYGWKHRDAGSLTADQVASWQGVRLLGVVRDPFAWALSTYKAPFHLGPVGADAGRSLADFLRTAPIATRRERRTTSVDSMWELWSHKARGLMGVASAWNVAVVRYEDVVLQPETTLEAALAPLGIERDHAPWATVDATARPWQRMRGGDHRTARDFAEQVRRRAWMDAFAPEDVDLARRTLDPEVLAHYRYPLP
jgi:hypothetical protein